MLNAIPAPVQRWMTLLLPPVSLLVCCFVMVPRQGKLRQVNKDTRAAQGEVTRYITQLKAIRDLPPDPVIATLPMTKQEQSDFLRALATLCSRTGNHIVSVTSLAAPPPSANPAPANGGNGQNGQNGQNASKTGTDLPADVLAIKSTIVFEGDFNGMRAFMSGIQRSRRLISMNECRIGEGASGFPQLRTTLTVVRYVDAPDAVIPPPAGQAAQTASASPPPAA